MLKHADHPLRMVGIRADLEPEDVATLSDASLPSTARGSCSKAGVELRDQFPVSRSVRGQLVVAFLETAIQPRRARRA